MEDIKASTQANWELARYATLNLLLGNREQAASALKDADRPLNFKDPVPDLMLQVRLAQARLDAAFGRRAAALARLEQARRDAEKLGLIPIAIEARSLSAELAGDAAALAAVEGDARAAGLAGLVARPPRGDRRAVTGM